VVVRSAIRWFSEKMEEKMAEHDCEYGKDGWLQSERIGLLRSLQDRVYELALDIRGGKDPTANAIHTANFSMMIADNWRGGKG